MRPQKVLQHTQLTTDLIDIIKRLKPDWTRPFCLRRQILRTNMPQAKSATSVHYDQLFFRYAPPSAVTAWIPIGDCPPVGGGLMYLDDSVVLGNEIEDEFTRLSKEKNLTEDEQRSAHNVNVGCDPLPMSLLTEV